MSKIQGVSNGEQVMFGKQLPPHQIELLKQNSASVEDIFNHLDDYNDDIREHYGEMLAEDEEEMSFEDDMDLDQELEAMSKEVDAAVAQKEATQQPVPPQAPEESLRDKAMELLGKSAGAPSMAQIEQLKARYGADGVNMLALGEGDVYIYTHLRRKQWQKIQEMAAKMAEAGNAEFEEKLKEKVVQHCTIWPKISLEMLYNSRAGVFDALYQAIMTESYFLDQRQVMMLTFQL